MEIKLSQEAMASLPEPDSKGLVRVTAALRVGPDGTATLAELNDQPIDSSSDEEKGEEMEAPDVELPDANAMEKAIYAKEG